MEYNGSTLGSMRIFNYSIKDLFVIACIVVPVFAFLITQYFANVRDHAATDKLLQQHEERLILLQANVIATLTQYAEIRAELTVIKENQQMVLRVLSGDGSMRRQKAIDDGIK